MKRKLWLNAFLTAPIIALYSAAPLYMSQSMTSESLLKFSLLFTATPLIIWAMHIYLLFKFPAITSFWRFTIVCTMLFVAHLAVNLFIFHGELPVLRMTGIYMAYPFFILLLPNITVLILCNNIVFAYKRLAAEKEVHELKLQNSEAQKQVLVQQLQPHFLFNTLGVLKSLVSTNQQKAEQYILRLSNFLQYTIHANTQNIISLEKELAFVKDYIALQKVRFGNAFISDIDIPADILQYHIPTLALQTLVENIFKHNQFTEKHPLTFGIGYNDGRLIVTNNKAPAKFVKKNLTGLRNLNRRYLLIANRGIEITETGTDFIVKIPIIK